MSDEELIAAFERAAIPLDGWHHREHLRVAWLYLRANPFGIAVDRIRQGIKRLNAVNGVPEELTSGYHETMTVAFMHILAATMFHQGVEESSGAFVDKHPHLQRSVLRLYYTRARIVTPEAKRTFVEPDIAPLPRH